MSIKIVLDNRPDFYTNIDYVSGKVVVGLKRPEQLGNIVVKLEGEAITALQVPHPLDADGSMRYGPPPGPPGSIVSEKHKILYKVQQVFPDEYYQSSANPYGAHPLHPGEHEFPFKFKLPINNACSDPLQMSKIGGLGNFGGPGLFGMGGVRVMDGSKQLFLRHVTRTLPPSFTGFPMEAEIRYYIKVTVQRPGLLKENWRFQTGFKFLPIEPPRPKKTGQEGFARRPFTFHPRSPAGTPAGTPVERKASSFFSKRGEKSSAKPEPGANDIKSPLSDVKSAAGPGSAPTPTIEMSARLPHPLILTCNQPVPLRLIAKKLANCPDQVYLTSFQMDLIGLTDLRCHNIQNKKVNRWVVANKSDLRIPLTTSPTDEVGKEVVVPDDIWKHVPLPNTVSPSFVSCNLIRRYELEIKLGLTWGEPAKNGAFSKQPQQQPVSMWLPLHFAAVEVFSGIQPPPELLEAARHNQPGRATLNVAVPRLPPRNQRPSQTSQVPQQPRPQPPSDPLYPPQLSAGQTQAPMDDAPPSYDEAMADNLAGPFDGLQERPAYSGVTNENQPSQMPREKS